MGVMIMKHAWQGKKLPPLKNKIWKKRKKSIVTSNSQVTRKNYGLRKPYQQKIERWNMATKWSYKVKDVAPIRVSQLDTIR
ncbi:hypothetical protein SESBI_45338 [Sesbania bispinosa]|nr:hypothetical protein SESBI_45338 [Sesbania bispinosa]